MKVDVFLEKVFNKYDMNGDGRLTWFEFTKVIKFLTKIMGCTLPKKHDIEDIFTSVDIDGDKTISREEYETLTKSLIPIIEEIGIKLFYKGKE